MHASTDSEEDEAISRRRRRMALRLLLQTQSAAALQLELRVPISQNISTLAALINIVDDVGSELTAAGVTTNLQVAFSSPMFSDVLRPIALVGTPLPTTTPTPTPKPLPPTTTPKAAKKAGLSVSIIVVIVVCTVVGTLAVGAAGWYVVKHRLLHFAHKKAAPPTQLEKAMAGQPLGAAKAPAAVAAGSKTPVAVARQRFASYSTPAMQI